MRPRKPPRWAALLLERFAPNEPLAGDLCEEFQAGRSALWYWQQVLFAIVAGPVRHTDMHQLFAVQGLFMQIVMLTLISVCAVFSVKLLGVVVFDQTVLRTLIGSRPTQEIVRLVLSFATAIPIGIAIARVHATSRRAALLAFTAVLPSWAFANLFLLDGRGNLDAVFPHVIALLVFIVGLLSGGIHGDLLSSSRRRPA